MDMPDYPVIPEEEIEGRISALQKKLLEAGLQGCLILDRINIFYYTGTIQSGTLFVPESGEPVFFIRRSLERAMQESSLKDLRRFKRFKEIPQTLKDFDLSRLGIDEGTTTVQLFSKFKKAFPQTFFMDIGFQLAEIRSVKSDYEVCQLREAGKRHELLYEQIPLFLHEGITEWELGAGILSLMLNLGFMGILRFSGLNQEAFCGNICFGESGNAPCAFEGPGGLVGQSPAFPLLGSDRRLQRGDIIFIDTGFGYNGYYTDKTRIFSLGRPAPEAVDAHDICLVIQEEIRGMLRPGVTPAEVYEGIFDRFVIPQHFAEGFMGYGGNHVKFLGHGIGLVIDEFPAIAKKVDYPLQNNMAIAIEPKKGLQGIGMVGIENTFLVTPQGGESITPGTDGITIL